ncbi:MAG: SPFH domain-containing protein [Bacteroidia bacterium]|nr:SPFH domain-containing protein [Bacteroidia bacterium]
MGLFDKIKGEFIDIIEWVDNTQDTMIWKFPRYQDEIKMGAKLTVRESQVALFLNEGKIADVFEPGMHTLTTQNMPIMTTLRGWKYGFNSPFKADVYFVSKKNFPNLKWGTKNPITLEDQRFGFVEFRAFGNYSMKVDDGPKFFREIAGTNPDFDTAKIQEQLRTWVVREITDALGESGIPIEKIAGSVNELSDLVQSKVGNRFDTYGLKVTDLSVENVSMPEELKKEIFELSRLSKIDINKLAQMKAAKSIETAAQNQGAMGGAMGMGMGFGMGNMMANVMGGMMNPQQQQNTNMPPPPPVLQFFVAVNGQQSGPFTMEQLGQAATAGQFKKESLVWKAGMSGWLPAEQVPELAAVFNQVPPPPPPPAG